MFENCVFDIHPNYPYLITTGLLDEADNPRKELKGKCWPNVSMQNCEVNVPATVKELYMFYTLRNSRKRSTIDHLSLVDIENVQINSSAADIPYFTASNVKVNLRERLKLEKNRSYFRLWTGNLKHR